MVAYKLGPDAAKAVKDAFRNEDATLTLASHLSVPFTSASHASIVQDINATDPAFTPN